MNKKYITILALLIAISAKSQLYFQFNSGYAKGINNKKYFDKENSYTNKPYYNLDTSNYSQYNLAQGFFIEPQLGYKITNWLEFSLGFYYNNNYLVNGYGNNFKYEEPKILFSSDSSSEQIKTTQQKISSSYSSKTYSFTPKLSVYKNFKKVIIGMSFGLSITKTYIYLHTDTSNYRGYIDSGNYEDIEAFVTYKEEKNSDYILTNSLYINYNIGINIGYKINNNFKIYLNSTYNSGEFIPNTITRTNTFEKTENIFFYDKINTTTNQSDEEITEDIEGYLFGMNTLQFSVGIRYIFGKTNKSVTSE